VQITRRPAPALAAVSALAIAASGCRGGEVDARRGETPTAVVTQAQAGGDAAAACRARVEALIASPALPGAPRFDAARIEFLGRARGEPMVFGREPARTPDESLPPAALASRRAYDQGKPGGRVVELARRHRGDPSTLRALVLRDGYAYADDPLDALAIVTSLKLTDLFAEPDIWLLRGADLRRLRRDEPLHAPGFRRETTYRYVDGPLVGRSADLLFGDRIATAAAALERPLHRDLSALADEVGFDRARLVHHTETAIVGDLRFGADHWARAVIDADGASLRLACLVEDEPLRGSIDAFRRAEAPRRRALMRLHDVVTEEVQEGMRFDRPEGETGPDRDGTLRPVWMTAYLSGRGAFEFEDASYPVFDPEGKPWPPQVCVDFVLDTFERTAGTWFRPRGEKLGRVVGRIDFNESGIANRRGVLAFGKFAEEHSELFEVRRFEGDERIPFRDRARFFGFLLDHADEIHAGDVVAIHGMKRDNRVHQHAILVERTDPLTGFPYGLADQMKRPRRRTWEGIMAEAPARSLLYRVRMLPSLITRLDPGEPAVAVTR